jgi:Tol biopolymer transport system component
MKISLKIFFLVSATLFNIFKLNSQNDQIESSKYKVGFSTSRFKNKEGNSTLVSIWYPSKAGKNKMTWADYIKTGGAQENIAENDLLNAFKNTIAVKWVFGIDIPVSDFEAGIKKTTNSYRNSKRSYGRFPLIIAFAEPISYVETFEFLASQGYIVASVTADFSEEPITDDSPQFFVKYTNLLEELLKRMQREQFVDSNKISVFGHGFSIQPAVYLAMRNPKIKSIINFDGGFFGERSKSTVSADYHPERLNIPFLHIITENQLKEDNESQKQALRPIIRQIIIENKEFRHHDFTSFGRFVTNNTNLRTGNIEKINESFNEINLKALYFLENIVQNNWQQITESPGEDFHCSFNQEGSKIVFDSNRSGHHEIYVFDLKTKYTTQITNNSFKSDHPHWSADGQHIFFDSFEDKEVNVNRYDFGTKKAIKLTQKLGNTGNAIPNPKGTKVAVLGQVNGKYDLFIMSADGTNRKNFTNTVDDDVAQMWSPDGQKIVYMSRINEHWQICMINADGTGFNQLTKGDYFNIEPYFSPDGSRIAFVSNREGNYGIYSMNLKGENIQKISKTLTGQKEINWLSWSPDGKNMLCSVGLESTEDIVLFNLKTGKMQKLTDNNFRDTNPSWSPDGKQITFVSTKSGNMEVYVMDLEK